jgi:hypothetical protein
MGADIFAGYKTSARSMSYAWYAGNHIVRAKLHENSTANGRRRPTLDTLKRLPYTLRVIKDAAPLHRRRCTPRTSSAT